MERRHTDQGRIEDPGERARRLNSAFLTRALGESRDYPRIPRRREDEGGFDALRARANGAELAARWWAYALQRVEPWTDS